MREPRIYVDCALQVAQELVLPAAASHHIGTVLRRRSGQHVWLFNGEGGSFLAEITNVGRRQVGVLLKEYREGQAESTLKLTLVQCVSRSQHMDFTLQKAVELGVSRIVPVTGEFGNVHIEDRRVDKKFAHWQKIMIGACEQCGRNIIPELLPPVPLMQWLQEDTSSNKVMLHPGSGRGLSSLVPADATLTLLSGAEGGFSDAEVEQALENNYVAIELGPRILRTETAAVAALGICQSLWGDMG